MKFCKECKHYSTIMYFIKICSRKSSFERCLVTGKNIHVDNFKLCEVQRNYVCECGPEAKYFEERTDLIYRIKKFLKSFFKK